MGEAQQDITAVDVELIYDTLVRPMGKKGWPLQASLLPSLTPHGLTCE